MDIVCFLFLLHAFVLKKLERRIETILLSLSLLLSSLGVLPERKTKEKRGRKVPTSLSNQPNLSVQEKREGREIVENFFFLGGGETSELSHREEEEASVAFADMSN